MTVAAFSVRLACGASRSMRAPMVACSVAGTSTSAMSRLQPVSAGCAPQHIALREISHDLLDKKRITGRSLGDTSRCQWRHRRIAARAVRWSTPTHARQ